MEPHHSTLIQSVGAVATVSTVVQFLSGLTVCAGFRKAKTTGETSSVTFISGVVMCYVWFKYGILIDDVNVSMVNSIGLVLHVFYSWVFWFYSNSVKKKTFKYHCIIAAAMIVSLFVVERVSRSPASLIYFVGFLGSGLSMLFVASPLISLRHVFQTKSTEVLPFYVLLAMFLVAGQWWVYGLLLSDGFLIFTNGANCIVALLQLSLFIVYPSKSVAKIDTQVKASVI